MHAAATRTTRRVRVPARRGLSMLEAILAVVLLTLLAGVILSVIADGHRTQINSRIRAAGHEVASRLILQWLDDRVQVLEMDRSGRPIDYGVYRFRWELDVAKAPVIMSRQPENREPNRKPPEVEAITARVWLVDDSDRTARRLVSDIPVAELTRLSNPVYQRNHDSQERLIGSGNTETIFKWFHSIQDARTLSGGEDGAGSNDDADGDAGDK